jgi:hypothetical protein
MKLSLQTTLLAVLLAACLPPLAAQARTYDVLTANVPFKFNIGSRTFSPGHYEFIFVGNGLMALRDAKQHAVAMLMTRSIEGSAPALETKLVFKSQKKNHSQRLAQIYVEKNAQVLEVMGEETAIQQNTPPPAAMLPPGVDSMFDRRSVSGFKH